MIKEKNTMKILGVNSGTSADSLDISLLRFSSQASNTQLFKLLHFSSFKYPTVLQREILYSGPSSKISDIESLSLKLGDFVAKKINFFFFIWIRYSRNCKSLETYERGKQR